MNHHQEGHLSAPDGTRLWFERDVPDGARAHLVLVHGYGDHLGRYRTFRDAMLAERFAVHAYDTRGHGRSDGRARRGRRLRRVHRRARGLRPRRSTRSPAGLPLFIVAHSHGGLITLRWLAGAGADAAAHASICAGWSSPRPTSAWPSPRRRGRRRPRCCSRGSLPSLPIPTGLASAGPEPGSRLAAGHRRGPALRPQGARHAGTPSTPGCSARCWPPGPSSGFQCC